MKIGQHEIGRGHPCVVVAEIGINHNGSLDTAKQLIDVAAEAGCQAVKFQKRTIDIVYSLEELAQPRESPFGTTNGDLKRHLEFDYDDYYEIDVHCRRRGILWFASPWDIDSVAFLEQFDPPAHKVASAMLTNVPLLEALQATGRPIIASTGMSTGDQITFAYEALKPLDVAFLACTSTYPSPVEDLNLNRIDALRALFHNRAEIGYSGHEVGLWTTLCAVSMGATIVERHITLNRASFGSDQAASLEPGGLRKLVEEIRTFEKAQGSGEFRMLESEKPVARKLRYHER